MTMLKVKRVYEKATVDDHVRILVDRLWPRGLTKDKAKIDLWLKDIAPSDSLRKWFAHDPNKWGEFKKRYFRELKTKTDLVKTVKDKMKQGTVTLLYGAKNENYNNAVALEEYLHKKR